MKLYGTPPSHFTRKVRVLLQELQVPCEFIPMAMNSLMQTGPEHFADNPLHQLPILIDGEKNIIESDIICEYLLDHFSKGQKFYPDEKNKLEDQKRLAIMNGGMSAGVKLIRAKRSEIPEFMNFVFFKQERAALDASLDWLEKDLGSKTRYYPGNLTMLDITLMCFVEWAVFREMVPHLNNHPNLARFVEANKNHPSFASTHPARAL